MRVSNVKPNDITLITLLAACADFPSETLNFGSSIHAYVHKLGLDKNNVKVGTVLVDMYSKFGQLDHARLAFDAIYAKNRFSWNTMIDGYMRNGEIDLAINLFDKMPERDIVSWTALIGGFVKQKRFEEALECFRSMQISKVRPDYVTFIPVLGTCADLGTLNLGLWCHRYILGQNFKDNIRINNSLIDMYSRSGCVEFALQVFQKMLCRSLVSWNSIIIGFAINGHPEEALKFFNLMQKSGVKADGITFTGALTACSHAGLVDKGLQLFDTMIRVLQISPRIEHYGCIIDLYSRAGRLEDALEVIKNMPMNPNEVIFGSLLAACRTVGNVDLAARLMNCIVELDPDSDSNYVMLSNIYAAVGSWNIASKVRMKMKDFGIQKKPGKSCIEIDGEVHEFVAGDKAHVQTEDIYLILELLSVELEDLNYAHILLIIL